MKDQFFVYCNESGYECFETLDDALDAANERIQGYLEDAWSDEVTSVCAGKITHRAKMCDQVFPDGEIDEEGLDESGALWDPDCEYKCNYKMLPVKKQSPDHLDDAPEVEQKPYAYEYGRDNGDGTFSVVMNKGVVKQLGENEYGYCHPGIFASKEWPVTPLYLRPQPAPDVAKVVESLEVAHRFIANGIELGYIQMPDSDTLDPAHETLPAIEAALAEYRTQGGDV